MDTQFCQKLEKMMNTKCENIKIIPISEEYLHQHSILWQRFDREKEIMESEYYQNIIRHRIHHPEHCVPKYTLINHCKIDLMSIAIDTLPIYNYFCWVDFGYCHDNAPLPEHSLDVNKLNKDCVNYTLIHPIQEEDKDIMYTLVNAPFNIGGFFFFGNKSRLKEYQALYHVVHENFQAQGLVDDDQHLALRCYIERPTLFAMHHLGWFHLALQHFQRDV